MVSEYNYPEDLVFAQTYAKGIKQREISKFRLLKHFMTSALLSDILDDFENEIIETIYNNFLNEKGIIEDIISNKSINEIITERGSF
ncbi:hypothetical protein IJG72_07215 [bacterium]|nr:hypothetical protein [bacterium]